MIHYLISTVLCSGVLILFYYLLLEKENCYSFNRFYLVVSLVASCIIPTLTYETSLIAENPIIPEQILYPAIYDNIPTNNIPDRTQDTGNAFIILYAIISFLLVIRVVYRYIKMIYQTKGYQTILHKGSPIRVTDEQLSPFSFMSFIVVNRKQYQSGLIREEILYHEMSHSKQKHTIDLLFIEIFQAIFWLNPLLIFYRRAILSNHEFLADRSVIKIYPEIKNYQKILLGAVQAQTKSYLSNQLLGLSEFNLTKKRLIKMKQKHSITTSIIKQIAVIPLLIAVFFLFSTKIIAQTTSNTEEPSSTVQVDKTYPCPEWGTVYCSVLKNYDLKGIKMSQLHRYISQQDQQVMIEIFKGLSPTEQEAQIVGFRLIGGPFKKNVPGQDQFESWKDEKLYGVWINDSRIENEALNNFTADSFSFFFISRLTKTAKNYGKHVYQLNLMTNDYFTNYNSNAKKRYHLYFKRRSPE